MSITFTLPAGTTIEDNHGVQHTDPVFVLTHYNKRCDENTNGHLSKDENGDFIFNEEAMQSNRQFYYQVQFWTDQAALDNGKDPMTFLNNGNSNLYFSLDTNPSTHAEIRNACQSNFIDEVIPPYVTN